MWWDVPDGASVCSVFADTEQNTDESGDSNRVRVQTKKSQNTHSLVGELHGRNVHNEAR